MVSTRKFSQFAIGNDVAHGDIIVGYEAAPNYNTQWTFVGGSGSGDIIATITQTNDFKVGEWVENIGGLYIRAQADNAMNAEVIGIVQSIITPGQVFTVQQSGYIQFPTLTPSLSFLPLLVSMPYFLDPDNAGQMTIDEPFVNGQVSRPVLVPDSPTSGWILPYRGYIVGGGAPVNPGITIVTKTIYQPAHGFALSDWLRTSTSADVKSPYTWALSDTLSNAQAVGIVVDVLDADHFILQVDGYVGPNIFPAPLMPGVIYYLSDTMQGKMQATAPTTLGEATKPLFSPDSASTGWILPQRPLTIGEPSPGGGGGVTWDVVQANSFNVGDWVRLDTTLPIPLYQLAQGDTAEHADVIGTVQSIKIPGMLFVLQQSGFCQYSVLTAPYLMTPGQNYFLDPITNGRQTTTEPFVNGEVSRPTMTSFSSTSGWVLPYRGFVVGGGAPVNPGLNIVTQTIYQPAHGFSDGDWLRNAKSSEPKYPYALADSSNLSTSYVVGVIIDVLDSDHFILQSDGYLNGTFVGFHPGFIWYLDPASPGQMTDTMPSTVGQVVVPLYSVDGTFPSNTGWIIPFRPILITSANSIPILQTFPQPSPPWSVGNWLITAPGSSPTTPYALANATSLSTSYVVGVVVQIVGGNFILQSNGYLDGVFIGFVPGEVWYLDPATPGNMTDVMPTSIGNVIVPLYSVDGTNPSNTGWILPFRPIEITPSTVNNILPVHQPGHPFTYTGQVAATTNSNDSYVLAIADTMAHAYKTIGFIQYVDASNFILIQSGYVNGFFPGAPPMAVPIAAGVSYFLSTTSAGNITNIEPTGLSTVSRPVLNGTDTSSGWILPQRPILNASGISTGGVWQLLGTFNAPTSGSVWDMPGTIPSGYTDIQIVGRGLTFYTAFTISGTNNYGYGMSFQVYTAAGLQTNNVYFTAGNATYPVQPSGNSFTVRGTNEPPVFGNAYGTGPNPTYPTYHDGLEFEGTFYNINNPNIIKRGSITPYVGDISIYPGGSSDISYVTFYAFPTYPQFILPTPANYQAWTGLRWTLGGNPSYTCTFTGGTISIYGRTS